MKKFKRKKNQKSQNDKNDKSKHEKEEKTYKENLVESAKEDIIKIESWLQQGELGYLEAEGNEKTYQITQQEIILNSEIGAAKKAFNIKLEDLGPYKIKYSLNGRHMLIGGRKGHLAEFDWQTGELLCEFQVRETVRDVEFLHNNLFWAAAQKTNVYIYDGKGRELHRLKRMHEPYALEYLPHHFLLCSANSRGYITWQDTSTGNLIANYPSKKGCCKILRQNPWNAILGMGHINGTVSMWSPNMNTPLVSMLCHRGPLVGLAFDLSGNYMVSAGLETTFKIWDLRKYELLDTYKVPRIPTSVDISQRSLIAITYGNAIEIWKDAFVEKQKEPYMMHKNTLGNIVNCRYCPYEDVLGFGHDEGVSSMLVPGSGEPNFDSRVQNPYQSKKGRREQEIRELMEKLPADLIMLDPMEIANVYQKDDKIYKKKVDTIIEREEKIEEEEEDSEKEIEEKKEKKEKKKKNMSFKRKRDLKNEKTKEELRKEFKRQRVPKAKKRNEELSKKLENIPSPLRRFYT